MCLPITIQPSSSFLASSSCARCLAWPVAVHCIFSLRSTIRALLSMAAIARRRWRQQTPAQSSTSTAPQHQNASFTQWDPALRVGKAIRRGSRHPCLHIIDCSTAQLSQPRNHHRSQLLGVAHALCDHSAQHSLSRCVVQFAGSHDRARPSFTSTTTTFITTAASHTPIPSYPTLHLTSCIAVVAFRGASSNHGPLQAFRFSSHTHTPTSGLHLATLVPLTLTRPPSRCTTRCDAWLTTHARCCRFILPSDRLACLLQLRHTAPTTPSVSSSANSLVTIIRFRFRATSRSQAATCASLCVASPRNVHTFTRAID